MIQFAPLKNDSCQINLMEQFALADSLWAATAQPGSDSEPLRERISADVAIVGAGFNGLERIPG